MTINGDQISLIEDYLKNSLWKKDSLYTDIMDHFCCIVETDMDNGLSFEEAFENGKAKFTQQEIAETQSLTFKLITSMETSFSAKQSFLAIIPVLFLGFCYIILGFVPPTVFINFIPVIGWTGFYIMAAIGWTKNFPRWVFPSLGFLFFTLPMSIMYGWKIYLLTNILFVLIFIVAIIVHPSVKPLQRLVNQVWKDTSSLLLMLMGFFMQFIMLFATDEIYNNWITVPYTIVTTLIFAAGIFIFLYSKKKKIRIIAALTTLIILFGCVYVLEKIAW
jgi:hypothetical protein